MRWARARASRRAACGPVFVPPQFFCPQTEKRTRLIPHFFRADCATTSSEAKRNAKTTETTHKPAHFQKVRFTKVRFPPSTTCTAQTQPERGLSKGDSSSTRQRGTKEAALHRAACGPDKRAAPGIRAACSQGAMVDQLGALGRQLARRYLSDQAHEVSTQSGIQGGEGGWVRDGSDTPFASSLTTCSGRRSPGGSADM